MTPPIASLPITSGPAPANNFNLLRLLFAAAVAVYHTAVLAGVAGWRPAINVLALGAELGVQGFFVLSGYLVYGSLIRSTSLRQYAEKRARRLYPAYATVVVVSALAALVLSEAARDDLAAVGRYTGWNLVFLNFLTPDLPGVFQDNAFREINGALWTLKIEVMFYLVLPLIAWLLRIAGSWRWALVAGIYIAAEVWRYVFAQPGGGAGRLLPADFGLQLPGQMSFFITGVGLAMWPRALSRAWAAPFGLVLLVLSCLFPQAEPMRALGLGLVAIWAATAAPRLPDAARFGDLSYGLYIVHFPVIQCIAAMGLFAAAPWAGAASAAIASLGAALLLWRVVERPALRADSAYRHAP